MGQFCGSRFLQGITYVTLLLILPIDYLMSTKTTSTSTSAVSQILLISNSTGRLLVSCTPYPKIFLARRKFKSVEFICREVTEEGHFKQQICLMGDCYVAVMMCTHVW